MSQIYYCFLKSSMLLLPVLLLVFADAAQAQTFEEFQRQQLEAQEEFERQQEQGVAMQEEAWIQFREEEQARFDAFREETERRWGNFLERTNKNWVEYTDGGFSRWDVDFEEGEAVVEVIAEAGESEAELRGRLQQTIQALAESRGTVTGLPDEEQPIQETPVLENQIDLAGAADISDLAATLADATETEAAPDSDETGGQILRIRLQLVPDHIRVRASRFREDLETYAAHFDIEPALLLAIMHTESYFNPAARSHANALGLMQIVPNTAGRDVYRLLNGTDGIPAPEFLFVPGNNIRFGSAYVDLLRNRYIRGVDSEEVHQLLVIAAYNTGAGNVARAYTGSTGVAAAVERANAMSEEENFAYLRENLPFAETRDYIVKVTERRDAYRQWLGVSE